VRMSAESEESRKKETWRKRNINITAIDLCKRREDLNFQLKYTQQVYFL
jgi:hypothetical protein